MATSVVVLCRIQSGLHPWRDRNKSRGPLLHRTSSSDRKATAMNRMHRKDLEACGISVIPFGSIPSQM